MPLVATQWLVTHSMMSLQLVVYHMMDVGIHWVDSSCFCPVVHLHRFIVTDVEALISSAQTGSLVGLVELSRVAFSVWT